MYCTYCIQTAEGTATLQENNFGRFNYLSILSWVTNSGSIETRASDGADLIKFLKLITKALLLTLPN
jgi:hypothetical protein